MLQQSAQENGTEASVVEANTMALNAMVRRVGGFIVGLSGGIVWRGDDAEATAVDKGAIHTLSS